jgi:uncharacterized protein
VLFVLHLLDKPASADLRQRVRPEHKAYLAQVADRIAFAGPLLHDDGDTMLGSLLVIDEPFTRTGLYAAVEIHAFVNLWPQRAGFPP